MVSTCKYRKYLTIYYTWKNKKMLDKTNKLKLSGEN